MGQHAIRRRLVPVVALVVALSGCADNEVREVVVGPQSIALRLPEGFHEVPDPADGFAGSEGSSTKRAWQAEAAPVHLLVSESPSRATDKSGLRAPERRLMEMILEGLKGSRDPIEWLDSKVEGDARRATLFIDLRQGTGERRTRSLLKIVSDERGRLFVEFRVPASLEADWLETGTNLLSSIE